MLIVGYTINKYSEMPAELKSTKIIGKLLYTCFTTQV